MTLPVAIGDGDMIYLDNAATTLIKPPEVTEAVKLALQKMGSAGRSSHRAAAIAGDTLFACRETAAKLFETTADRVVFTFNATHGINIAIKTLVKRGDKVVISGFEHNAVLRPLHEIGAQIVVAGRKLFDVKDTERAFEKAIDGDTAAVICTHVSNVFGYILPIDKIANLCAQKNVPFVLDAAQSAGVLPISMKKLNAAFIAMPGHKGLFGPQGTGILLCGDIMPKTVIEGGTGSFSKFSHMPMILPDRLEVGTLNCHGIAGLLAGINYIDRVGVDEIKRHELYLLSKLKQKLKNEDLRIYQSDQNQIGVLSFVHEKLRCEAVGEMLSEADFAVRTGFHCAPLAHESVGSIETGTIRVSISAMTKESEIVEFSEFMNDMKKL